MLATKNHWRSLHLLNRKRDRLKAEIYALEWVATRILNKQSDLWIKIIVWDEDRKNEKTQLTHYRSIYSNFNVKLKKLKNW